MKALAALALLLPIVVGSEDVRVRDLDDKLLDPFQTPATAKALVFIFVSVDCPISNRYAPDVRRLYDKYSSRGVVFSLVYPNPAESSDVIRRHLREFSYPVRAMRDPRHDLVKVAGVTITPEAAVYDRQRRLLYHGRIDNRYKSLGVERPVSTQHDLDDVLGDVVAGRPVRQASAPAVGCFIADFVQ